MSKFFEQKDVSIEEQIIRDVHHHEVLLSFNDDDQAEAFCDWWSGDGISAFEKWCKKNGESYE